MKTRRKRRPWNPRKKVSFREERFPRLAYLLASFARALNEFDLRGVTSSTTADLAFVLPGDPIIHFSDTHSQAFETLLEAVASIVIAGEEAVKRLIDTPLNLVDHEYVHVEEFREDNTSSHMTHESEGDLPKAFFNRMRQVVERLADADWDLGGEQYKYCAGIYTL